MINYTHILDLAKEVEPPADGKVSKIIFEDDGERQRYSPRQLPAGRLDEDETEANDDDRVRIVVDPDSWTTGVVSSTGFGTT